MLGNDQLRGRRWDEPYPSNLHFIANRTGGDPSPAGVSGRWAVLGNNVGPITLIDLWSGDGRDVLFGLSFWHGFQKRVANSVADNDSYGSADGTKIVFESNYDLEHSPWTKIAEDMSGPDEDRIVVHSTEGFPEAGHLSIQNEIIKYNRKTATTFEGLSREQFGASAEHPGTLSYLAPYHFNHYTDHPLHLLKGLIVTSFDHRLISEDQRDQLILPDEALAAHYFGSAESPIAWQRRPDVNVAIVRLPDAPVLRRGDNGELQLIPGENHAETRGYRLFFNGEPIQQELITQGNTVRLRPGSYTAVAVEWSGLESSPSKASVIETEGELALLHTAPEDFSWTQRRWTVAGETINPEKAGHVTEAICETVHYYDGVIKREHYEVGGLIQADDLNSRGQPTRRCYYHDGKMSRREYYQYNDSQPIKVSEEIFDDDGFITDARKWGYDLYLNGIRLNSPYLKYHWRFDRGHAIRLIGSCGYFMWTHLPAIHEIPAPEIDYLPYQWKAYGEPRDGREPGQQWRWLKMLEPTPLDVAY